MTSNKNGINSHKIYSLRNNIVITEQQLIHWNTVLSKSSSPQDIIKWALMTSPHLFQTTAFGLTGLATIDIISKLKEYNNDQMVPLLFIDTLYHYPQTIDLLQKVEEKYYVPSDQSINVFKPKRCSTVNDFVDKYGDFLWNTDDAKYDFLVKV